MNVQGMFQFTTRKFHLTMYTRGLQIRSISFGNRFLFKSRPSAELPQEQKRRGKQLESRRWKETAGSKAHNSTEATGTNSSNNNTTHPRNSFQGSYDMERLSSNFPDLQKYLRPSHTSTANRKTVNFSDPYAVKALNAALLASDYGLTNWESFLPPSALIPPIPGRADYIHNIADILYESATGQKPTMNTNIESISSSNVLGLDIGVGASLIYPLIGTQTYGWSFLGTDVDKVAIESAQAIIMANGLSHKIDIRKQQNKYSMLHGILKSDEKIDFVMCNPPFYPTEKSFRNANKRKIRNLAINSKKRNSEQQQQGGVAANPNIRKNDLSLTSGGSNNFLGRPMELWYPPGGEVAFVSSIVRESFHVADRCLWFSSLMSRRQNASLILDFLAEHTNNLYSRSDNRNIKDIRLIPIGQGQKKTNIVFWTFHNGDEQQEWCHRRLFQKQ